MRLIKFLPWLAPLALLAPAQARDNGQWNDSPWQVRRWFQQLMQPDNPNLSCCGEADAFEADTFEVDGDHYIAVITEPENEVGCRKSDRPRHSLSGEGSAAGLLRHAGRSVSFAQPSGSRGRSEGKHLPGNVARAAGAAMDWAASRQGRARPHLRGCRVS